MLDDSESNLLYFVGVFYDLFISSLTFIYRRFQLYCLSMLDVVLIRHPFNRSKFQDKDPQVHLSVSWYRASNNGIDGLRDSILRT